jgi:hypothetical protein
LLPVTTSYGRVDCLLERGRLDWDPLRRSAVRIPVADARVLSAVDDRIGLAPGYAYEGVPALRGRAGRSGG